MAASSDMAGHEEMGCCAPDCAPRCAIACPGAVLPLSGPSIGAAAQEDMASSMFRGELPSADPGTTDPPPRTTTS